MNACPYINTHMQCMHAHITYITPTKHTHKASAARTIELDSQQRGGAPLVHGGVVAEPEVDDVLLRAALGVGVQQDIRVAAKEVSVRSAVQCSAVQCSAVVGLKIVRNSTLTTTTTTTMAHWLRGLIKKQK
jgi:hypothetical protein